MIRRKTIAGLVAVLLGLAGATVVAAPAYALPQIYYGHVYNGASIRCLDSGVVANAQLWPCSSAIYQSWSYNIRFGRTIRGNSPSGCLDDGAGLNGSGAFLTACSGGLHQVWYYDTNYGYFTNAASGRCLDADEPTLGQNGTKVQVWDCNGGYNQRWYFEYEP